MGSFFSDRDFRGPGARNFLIPIGPDPDNITAIPRTPDEGASSSGQWGTALHWITEGDTDFGLYYINAHSKAPAYQVNYGAGGVFPESYTIRYFEDIQGYAASFTTVMADTNIQGEVSYKTDVPVVLFNRSLRNVAISSISCDNVDAGRHAANLLLDRQHRRLAFISGSRRATSNFDRMKGFADRVMERNPRNHKRQLRSARLHSRWRNRGPFGMFQFAQSRIRADRT